MSIPKFERIHEAQGQLSDKIFEIYKASCAKIEKMCALVCTQDGSCELCSTGKMGLFQHQYEFLPFKIECEDCKYGYDFENEKYLP